MQPETIMEKYLFKGRATALKGSIRKPYFQDLGQHLAIATYAGSRGRMECVNRGFALGEDIQYDFARTQINADEDSGIYTLSVTSQVLGLRIGGWLSVEEVTCRLTSVFDGSTYPEHCLPRISPAGSIIRNLQVNGKVQELKFPDAFQADPTSTEAFFRGESDDDKRLFPGYIPEPLFVTGFGTIYYAEWTWVHPNEQHRQHLTMLRLALGSDGGASIDAGDGCANSTGYPPTSP
jgi:hypothetical protein